MKQSIHLLPPVGDVISLTGDPIQGDGWFGHTTGLHTVAINVQNFRGRIMVQASIATNPGESDWFSVLPNGAAYLQYPRPGTTLSAPLTGESSTYGFNFLTNAVWVRAIMDRAYLIPSLDTPLQIMGYGTVNYIMLNY